MPDDCSQIAQILHRNIPHGIEVVETAGATKTGR